MNRIRIPATRASGHLPRPQRTLARLGLHFHVAMAAILLSLATGSEVANADADSSASPTQTHAAPAPTDQAATITWGSAEVVVQVEAKRRRPILLGDSAGGLHLLFAAPFPLSIPSDQVNGLAYLRNTTGRWSESHEVSRTDRADLLDAIDVDISDGGWLHAIWRGRNHQIEYRHAHVSDATRSEHWGKYRRLSDPHASGGAIRTAPGGIVHVAWSELSGTARYRRMQRDGQDIDDPVILFEGIADREAANRPVLATDDRGGVHALWAVHGPAPDWLPHTLLYRGSANNGTTWRDRVRVATGEVYDPVVVASQDEIVALWSEVPSIGKRMHSISIDGGRNWSAAHEVDPQLRGGLHGPMAAVADSAGTLHLLVSTGRKILHTARRNGGWSSSISQVAGTPTSLIHFDRVSAAVTNGNRLHIVARRGDTIEHFEAVTDAPAQSPRAIPPPAPLSLTDRAYATSIPLRVLTLSLALLLAVSVAMALRIEPRPQWVTWVPHLTVATGAALIGRWGNETIEAIAASLLALSIVVRPELGLIALISAGTLSPWRLDTDTNTQLSVGIAIVPFLCVVWVVSAVRRRDVWTLLRGPGLALVLLTVVAATALVAANQGWIRVPQLAPLPAQLGGLAVFGLSAAVFIVAADSIRDEAALTRLSVVFLATFTLAMSGWLIPEFDRFGAIFRQLGSDGSLAWTWMIAIAFGQIGFNRRLDWRLRALLALLGLSILFRAFVGTSSWISGWLPPSVAILASLALGAPRLAAVIVLIGAVGAAMIAPSVASFVAGGDNLYSLGTRLDAWRIMGAIILESPLIGSGPANYYFLTPAYEIRGHAVPFSSHNNYIDILAQSGLVGLACFGAFAAALARRIWSLRDRCGDGFARGYWIGATGGFAGTLAAGMLGDWIFPFVYNVGLDGLRASLPAWVLMGGILALHRIRATGAGPASTAMPRES